MTAMIWAACNGHLAVEQLLVSSGADTNIQTTVSYIYTTPTLYNKHNDVDNDYDVYQQAPVCALILS